MEYVYQVIGPDDEPRLRDENAYLDRLLIELIHHAHAEDWRSCESIYALFSSEVEQHMRYEECLLFPSYMKTQIAAEGWVDALRAEHQELRHQMQELLVGIQQRTCCAERLERFATHIRDHHARESRIFYPWMAALPAAAAQWRRLREASGGGVLL